MAMLKERFRRPDQIDSGVRVHPIFDDFHLLTMEGKYEYPRHVHSNYELILVERGPYRCEVNGAELTLKDGQILVVKPGDQHQDHLSDGQRHYVLHFRFVADARGIEPVAIFRPRTEPALQICRGNHLDDIMFLRELKHEAQQSAAHAPVVQDCLLEVLVWRTIRDLPAQALSDAILRLPKEQAMREQIVAAMKRQIRGSPSVFQLAEDLEFSPRQLAAHCKGLFGLSPARLFMQVKMRHAEVLLRSREFRIKEVSDELGFANPYHFSRVFRRHFGRPPSQI